MPIARREVYLENGRVTIDCPRLMTYPELAEVLAAFVDTIRARPPKPSPPVTQERPSPQAALNTRSAYTI